MSIDLARKVADAVLYEGYVLYPYRASSPKNRMRWQFGVLGPRSRAGASDAEPWASQTECLIEPGDDPRLEIHLRFLQIQARTVQEEVAPGKFRPVESLEVGGSTLISWEEGVEQEVPAVVSISGALSGEQVVPFGMPGGGTVEPVTNGTAQQPGRIVRRREPISGRLTVSAERGRSPFGAIKVRLGVENTTNWSDGSADRAGVLLRSLVAAHMLMGVTDGSFISLLEPPEWAREDAEQCANVHTWPVLVGADGARDAMLSSPIILYDYPQIAPESPGDLFDATEIDEILSLRTMALTEEEKREARATDPLAAQVIDRIDSMPPEVMDRLHGAVRYLREPRGGAVLSGASGASQPSAQPWWDPGADESVSPESDTVLVRGTPVSRGNCVRLRPGARRADAQDVFLEGRAAKVEAVLSDVDDEVYLAVTLEDDPAAELQQAHGRFLYFRPDEVEPLEVSR